MALLEAIEMRRVRLPLVAPFRTAHGACSDRDVLLLRVLTIARGSSGRRAMTLHVEPIRARAGRVLGP